MIASGKGKMLEGGIRIKKYLVCMVCLFGFSQARIAGGLAGCFACPAAGPLRGWVEGRSPTRRRQSSRQGPRRGRFTAIGFRASSFLIPSELVRSRASSCHLGTPRVTPGLALCV